VTARPIGIVAVSAEGAALCYRTICVEAPLSMGRHAHPPVIMHSPSLAEYMGHIERGGWEEVGELLLASARLLAAAGAEILICPDNTAHRALSGVIARSPASWLHIADPVLAEAQLRGYQRVGLLGTRWLVESDVYPARLVPAGIDVLTPTDAEAERLNRIIADELVAQVVRPESQIWLLRVIARMAGEGCDAVLLGGTELPLVIDDTTSSLPTLDSTRLLARAALRASIGAGPAPPVVASGVESAQLP
jgi:aspartate racemase